MTISEQPPNYRSFLLRLWEERSEQSARRIWRCSLEDPLTGSRHGFANMAALTDWLNTELAKPATGPAGPTTVMP